MDSDAPGAVQQELHDVRDQLDALRSGICSRLRLSAWRRGPDGETVTMPTDEAILEAIERLQITIAAYEAPVDAAELPWAAIDAMIFVGRKMHAIQAIRTEFGDDLRLALDRLCARYKMLRREKPDGFTIPAEIYWDGFYS